MTHEDLALWGERAWARFVRILPLRAYTRAMRALGGVPLPESLREPVFGRVASLMGMDLREAELPVSAYRTFTDLFVRRLQPGARLVAGGDALVSPVDGLLTTFGEVRQGVAIQAKGINYSVEELCGDAAVARSFEGGRFYTVYLRPKDYHRIHCPVAARLLQRRRLGGRLLPVKPYMVRNVADLLARNERVWFLFEASIGKVLLVCVAAAGVGTITSSQVAEGTRIEKGDEVAAFNIGSTVILFTQAGGLIAEELTPDTEVRVGQVLARASTVHGSS